MRFMAKKNIKELLNKYKEKGVEHIEDKGQFITKSERSFSISGCEICKNYDSEKCFCNTYDCDPLQFEYDYEIFVEDYCREFTVDKIKEAKVNKNVKKLQM